MKRFDGEETELRNMAKSISDPDKRTDKVVGVHEQMSRSNYKNMDQWH